LCERRKRGYAGNKNGVWRRKGGCGGGEKNGVWRLCGRKRKKKDEGCVGEDQWEKREALYAHLG